MTFSIWALVIGLMFIMMALAGSLMKRLPVSASMFYLAVGYGLGIAGWGPMEPDSRELAPILERVTEVALLISLFSVGMKLGLPFSSHHWRLPLRLAFISMALTVGLITLVGCLSTCAAIGGGCFARRYSGPDRPGARLGCSGGRA
jgi:NhaP-type Na+/H+ or K+/H+ antiporter